MDAGKRLRFCAREVPERIPIVGLGFRGFRILRFRVFRIVGFRVLGFWGLGRDFRILEYRVQGRVYRLSEKNGFNRV